VARAFKADPQQVERPPEQKVFSFTGVFATACRLLASLGGVWVLASQAPRGTLTLGGGGWIGLMIVALGVALWNEWNIHRRGAK
jgi:hypothetical protein